MRRLILILLGVVALAAAAWFLFFRGSGTPPVYAVTVVKTMPHDPEAFTQGLFYRDGHFYESTGGEGTSNLRKVDPATGKVLQQQDLSPAYFGEGIVDWGDRVHQVTWKNQQGFTYTIKDFTPQPGFSYEGEGWGLTRNDKNIILSDGTPVLRFLDPSTMKEVSKLTVTANGCPVEELNELEWVDGEIYANIWQTKLIARIDPATGNVKSFLDVTGLGPQTSDPDAVPNGIAYDGAGKRLFLTGKRWPELYEVREGSRQPDSAPAMGQAAQIMACKAGG